MAKSETRAGTVPEGGGSSMPAGTQVKKIQVTSTKYRQPDTPATETAPPLVVKLPIPGKPGK